MSGELFPGLIVAIGGCACWLAVLIGAWLSPMLPPAGPSFRVLRTAPVASAAAMWTAIAGFVWMGLSWMAGAA